MAISDRITSIEEHIKESYQELEGLGIDTTGVNKNLENIPKLIDGYWETLPKVTGEGTSITLDNTKEGKMKINLKGNTSQATSILPSGYTQVDYIQSSGTQYIDTGYTFTSTKEKIDFKYTPLVIENARVCGSYISQHRGMIIQPRQQDMAEVGNTGITPTFSISANTDYKVMLEANEGNYTFEFGENSQTGTYTSTPITNRSHYIFAVNYTGTTTKASMKLYYYKMYDNDVLVRDYIPCYRNSDNEIGLYDLVNNVFYTNAGTGTFTKGNNATLPNPDYPQEIHVVSGDNTIIVSNSDNTQSQSYPISLGDIELCKIGDYQDSIVKDNGKWYVNKQIGKVIINENSGISRNEASGVFYLSSVTDYLKINSITSLANYYKSIANVTSLNDIGVNQIALSRGSQNRVFINDQRFNTIELYKTWLSTNNVIVYYILATLTTTEITDSTLLSQLNALAKSYEGQTNISQVNNDNASILNATALSE